MFGHRVGPLYPSVFEVESGLKTRLFSLKSSILWQKSRFQAIASLSMQVPGEIFASLRWYTLIVVPVL